MCVNFDSRFLHTSYGLALENTALNVVCNQEYAQAVPHVHLSKEDVLNGLFGFYLQVHYHVIPAPTFESSRAVDSEIADGDLGGKTFVNYQEMHENEFKARGEELDQQDADILVRQIRARL